MALSIYRQLLRSTRIAFQGDIPTLTAARRAAREGFESNRDTSDPTEALQHAKDVAMILRQNIVQGKFDESKDRYKLNIHEEIERGDNESIKNPPPIIRGKRNTLKGVKASTL